MAKAWRETVVIPTYEPGLPEKNPVFLEKRVYQGSSGAVYPYPVIESVSDEKHDKAYEACFLENEYLIIMVLPELGGRIQMAYDKIKQRHFIYCNHVVKPALVGLTGPWISGGIEFNWPQHHRPSTFLPVDCTIKNYPDGSVSVIVSEMEKMTRQKGMAEFVLHPGCAYLEIRGTLFNRTDVPQTFLWWANPAVAVNDHYQSVFPPDVNAVFDHGKRAVSTFPIATGTYYKMDYSAGVDISNYRNIKVPTSYMAVNSRYDFEGGYENDTRAGMLHVASHHFSPGKKQWTWGNGDFGRAWDRQLTDEDGPYIELMAGVFTENQPDFSWLMPYEEKTFTQYFMPYRELGVVKNASRDVLMNLVHDSSSRLRLKVFATSRLDLDIIVCDKDGTEIMVDSVILDPTAIYDRLIPAPLANEEDVRVEIRSNGKLLLEWEAEPDEIKPIPSAAEAALPPSQVKTCEQLYLTGLHLEQYRHATFNPADYYKEALRRDPDDYRCNNALGLLYLRKGRPELAEKYFSRAVAVITKRNPNPYDGEPVYNLGLSMKYLGKLDRAYDRFMKATWNAAWKDAAFFEAAQISGRQKRWEDALYETEQCLARNSRHHKARSLRIALLLRFGLVQEAMTFAEESLRLDPFNFSALFLKAAASDDESVMCAFKTLMRRDARNYEETALDFTNAGLFEEAEAVWRMAEDEDAMSPMGWYYHAWNYLQAGDGRNASEAFATAASMSPDYCFPNRPEAILALLAALKRNPDDGHAHHYLGNLYYDKRQYDLAVFHWESALQLLPDYPGVRRNLALACFNKLGDTDRAIALLEEAFRLDDSDARILMELDQLYKRVMRPHFERLRFLLRYPELVERRDDLYVEVITLLNQTGQWEEAARMTASRKFHPWEGGEGKVSAQYQYARVEMAKRLIGEGECREAVSILNECLVFPDNLGEGKLAGAQDNDINYLLGLAYRLMGRDEEARHCFTLAAAGPYDPSPALYYNDAKPDKIFYAGLALRALGQEEKARGVFHRLVNYGSRHLGEKVEIDYFAVSLPDLLIWEDDLDLRNEIHCRYMLALGYAGLGDLGRYERYSSEAETLDINHQGLMSTSSLISLLKPMGRI